MAKLSKIAKSLFYAPIAEEDAVLSIFSQLFIQRVSQVDISLENPLGTAEEFHHI